MCFFELQDDFLGVRATTRHHSSGVAKDDTIHMQTALSSSCVPGERLLQSVFLLQFFSSEIMLVWPRSSLPCCSPSLPSTAFETPLLGLLLCFPGAISPLSCGSMAAVRVEDLFPGILAASQSCAGSPASASKV